MKRQAVMKIQSKIDKVVAQDGFYQPGKPWVKEGGSTAVLLIPGFDDDALIMSEFATSLAMQGFTVYSTILPGRGLDVEAFGSSRWQNWVDSAVEDYLLLHEMADRVFIAGFSTGATTALRLSEIITSRCEPAGLILVSPALFFVSWLLPLSLQKCILSIMARINPYPRKLKNRHRIFFDPEARRKYDRLERSSFQAVIELYNLALVTRDAITDVSVPVCIMQSTKDVVVLPRGAKWLYRSVLSKDKELHMFHGSGHPLVVDYEKDDVFRIAADFIRRVSSNDAG
jgi:carboxylesterase